MIMKYQLVLLSVLTFGEMKWKEMDGIPANARNGYAGSSIFMGFILWTWKMAIFQDEGTKISKVLEIWEMKIMK